MRDSKVDILRHYTMPLSTLVTIVGLQLIAEMDLGEPDDVRRLRDSNRVPFGGIFNPLHRENGHQ